MGAINFIKPPFNEETARAKVKAAQDAWNTRNPEHVAQVEKQSLIF
jgi:nuclear transport factor 2 (NTF2) superfamily protein